MTVLAFGTLAALARDRFGRFDVACPACGPDRRSPTNGRRRVLRVWRHEPDFLTYYCCRCGLKGSARRDGARRRIDPQRLEHAHADAAARDARYARSQLEKARALYRMARPAPGTPAETYLRSRGLTAPIPPTIRFLKPGKPEHHPAIIVPFGLPNEPEPGMVAIRTEAIVGVHLTLLKPDGSEKAAVEPNKLTVGRSIGSPIVLAPCNDLLGMAIAEGVEDAMSIHQATGLGAWAAGCASRMPALVHAIPAYVAGVVLLVDDDPTGRRNAHLLAAGLRKRGFDVELLEYEIENAA
jgi:hypothetical protein